MANSDVFVTFGGDTGALESAIAVVKSQMNSLSGEMRKAANEFNKAGVAADSDLGKKLKTLGVEMAKAKGEMAKLQAGAKDGGDAIKAMAQKIGDAAYNFGPWTGQHVEMAQAMGVGLVKAAQAGGAAVSALGLALGGIALASVGAIAVIGAQTDSLRKLDDAARATKVSIAALRELNVAGKSVGIDAETMNTEMIAFGKSLRDDEQTGGKLADFLKANNIALKDMNGNMRPVQKVFGDVFDLVMRTHNELDRLAILTKVGFSDSAMLRLFERQSEAVTKFANSSKNAQDDVAHKALEDGETFSRAWHLAVDELGESITHAAVEIIGFDTKLRDTIATFRDMAVAGVKSFAEIATAADRSAAAVGEDIAKIAIEKARQAAVVLGGASLASGKNPFGTLDTHAFGPPKGGDKSPPGLYDTDDDKSKKAKTPKVDRSEENAALKGDEDSIKAAHTAAKAKESLLAEGVKLHLISEDEKLAGTKQALDQEYVSELNLLQKELEISGLKLEQKQAINDKIKALDAKYASDSEKATMQSVERQAQSWDRLADTMTGSMGSAVTGLIEHTETFSKAMLNLERSMLQSFIKMGTDIVADWAKKQIATVILTQTAEGQKTAAALAGAAAREGASAGEATAGLGALIASAAKAISVAAGQTGAEVAAFLAPVMGPAAVPAGIAAAGAVTSIAKYDIGAYRLDQDQIAMVHKNEMIMPAAEAGAFRSMLSGAANGGAAGAVAAGGDSHVHLNVNALDSGSVKSWLGGNSRQIMKAMSQAVKNGDHLGLRRLGGL